MSELILLVEKEVYHLFLKKKKIHQDLLEKKTAMNEELQDLKNKIRLIKNNDIDYLDMLYREKFKYGTKDELLIKLK